MGSRLATHGVFLVLVVEPLLRPCFASLSLLPQKVVTYDVFKVVIMMTTTIPNPASLTIPDR
jgi:hypothetical protein